MKYKVCIHCIVYNHERYLEDALNGFVNQRTNFPYIAVILDDCSTDRSAEIIRRYESQYPDIIKPIYLKENYFSQGKSKRHFFKPFDSESEYLAFCDGDDYWTDPLKLQKQIDILDSDPTLIATASDTLLVDQYGERYQKQDYCSQNKIGRVTFDDFCERHQAYPAATLVWRNNHQDEVDTLLAQAWNRFFTDWILCIILHQFGDFWFQDEKLAAYRDNPSSLTHTYDRVGRAKISLFISRFVCGIVPRKYVHFFAENVRMYINVAYAYKHNKQYICCAVWMAKAFLHFPGDTFREIKEKLYGHK